MPAKTLITYALQRYWRITRALTMGAQGVVIDDDGRILLVRHTYRPGWHFPGGGVEKNEAVATALVRELHEEAGIIIEGKPELFGIYANFNHFPSDHITLFVVRSWSQPTAPKPNREIAEHRFFARSELPKAVHPNTVRRLDEILDGRQRDHMW